MCCFLVHNKREIKQENRVPKRSIAHLSDVAEDRGYRIRGRQYESTCVSITVRERGRTWMDGRKQKEGCERNEEFSKVSILAVN
jgi:hypothetical protein